MRYKCTLSVAKTLLTLTAEHGAFAEYEILVNWKNCPYSVRSIRCVKGRIGDRSKLGESWDYIVPGLSHPQGRCCMHRRVSAVCVQRQPCARPMLVSTLSEPFTPRCFPRHRVISPSYLRRLHSHLMRASVASEVMMLFSLVQLHAESRSGQLCIKPGYGHAIAGSVRRGASRSSIILNSFKEILQLRQMQWQGTQTSSINTCANE